MASVLKPDRRLGLQFLKSASTPDRLRVIALATVVTIVALGALSWFLTDRLVGQTKEVATSTGEVLVATQQLTASLAEADTAAASVHLAGADGNREQLRLYEQASERSASLLEDVARLVGEDERSHSALSNVAERSTRYVGLIESARLASERELSGADEMLQEASSLNRSSMLPEVQVVADRARNRFDSQTQSGWYLITILALIISLIVMFFAHASLTSSFNRRVNIPVAIACFILLGLVLVSGRAYANQRAALSDAQLDAESILASQEIQENAYRHRSLVTNSVLTNDPASAELVEIENELSSTLLGDASRATQGARELAAVAEISERWDRYVNQSARIQGALDNDSLTTAEEITQGQANSAFNGFNTAIEAALLDNREQFLGELQDASDAMRWLRGSIFIGSLLAALLAWWGFSQRIGEYR